MAQQREYQRTAMGPNSNAISEGDQVIIKEKGERPCGTYLLGNVGLYLCLLKGFLKINPCGMNKGMKSERVALRQPLFPFIPLCGIYILIR